MVQRVKCGLELHQAAYPKQVIFCFTVTLIRFPLIHGMRDSQHRLKTLWRSARIDKMSWLSQIGVCVGFWQFQVIPVFEDQAIKVSRTYRKNAEALQDAKVRVIRGAAFMRIATGYMIELALPGNESDQFQDMLRDPLHERWIDPTFKEDLERALSSELLRIKQSVQNIASQMMSLAATLELDLSIVSVDIPHEIMCNIEAGLTRIRSGAS